MQIQMTATRQHVRLLEFSHAAQIIEHQLRAACRESHDIEIVERRCEKGIFLRSRQAPAITVPVRLAHGLTKLPAWRGVRLTIGLFLEGFNNGMDHSDVEQWMMTQTRIDRYKWMMEGDDLFIAPRDSSEGFTPEMIQELESIGAVLERRDDATVAVYVEVFIPY